MDKLELRKLLDYTLGVIRHLGRSEFDKNFLFECMSKLGGTELSGDDRHGVGEMLCEYYKRGQGVEAVGIGGDNWKFGNRRMVKPPREIGQ